MLPLPPPPSETDRESVGQGCGAYLAEYALESYVGVLLEYLGARDRPSSARRPSSSNVRVAAARTPKSEPRTRTRIAAAVPLRGAPPPYLQVRLGATLLPSRHRHQGRRQGRPIHAHLGRRAWGVMRAPPGSPAKSCEVLLPWRAQKLTNNCSESRDVGQMLGPKLTNTLRSSHKVGRPWPQLIKSWPSPARVGRTWPVFGPNRPNLDQVRHQCWLAKFEQILAQTGQLWSLAKSR